MKAFKRVVENRRSVNILEKSYEISQEEVLEMIQHAIQHSPSAFNAQSVSAIVLFDKSHHKLWDEVTRQILPFVPQEKHANTISKIDGFKGGDGTIIFLEDTEVAKDLQRRFPLYQDNVKLWADQGQGFAQYAVWLALSNGGLSATLQHYNPLIDPFIMEHFDVDTKFQVVAQMPFGKAKIQPTRLEKKDIQERVWKK